MKDNQHQLSIPTKAYIQDYILKTAPVSNKYINNIVLTVINNNRQAHFRNYAKTNLAQYDAQITVVISESAMKRHKTFLLTPEKIGAINNLLAEYVKTLILEKMKVYLQFDNNITRAIEYCRKELGIDEEHLADCTIKKFYQRSRANDSSLPYIYSKPSKTLSLCPSI